MVGVLQDTSWLDTYLSDIPHVVYQVDDPQNTVGAQHATLVNKGNEAMGYLQFIIDYYDRLPDSIVFVHGHRCSIPRSCDLSSLQADEPIHMQLRHAKFIGFLCAKHMHVLEAPSVFDRPFSSVVDWASLMGPREVEVALGLAGLAGTCWTWFLCCSDCVGAAKALHRCATKTLQVCAEYLSPSVFLADFQACQILWFQMSSPSETLAVSGFPACVVDPYAERRAAVCPAQETGWIGSVRAAQTTPSSSSSAATGRAPTCGPATSACETLRTSTRSARTCGLTAWKSPRQAAPHPILPPHPIVLQKCVLQLAGLGSRGSSADQNSAWLVFAISSNLL